MTPCDDIPYRRWFPWLRLFGAIGMAFSLRQLIVAAGAICVLSAGQWVLESSLSRDVAAEPPIAESPIVEYRVVDQTIPGSRGLQLIPEFVISVGQPWIDAVQAVAQIVETRKTAGQRLQAAGYCSWLIAVWSLFGLALCRLSARRLALGECGSFRKAIQFGVTRWVQGIIGPLIPTAAAALILGFAIVVLYFCRLPWIGPALAYLASPAVAICSLIAGFLLIAMLVGWPLMLAAIAYDDCDGFGGLSRSYSQWTGRPRYFLWAWGIGAFAGAVALALATSLGHWTLYLASLVIHAGLSDVPTIHTTEMTIRFLILFVIHAYAISYFWTTATIIYALLRQSVDWMPINKLAPDDDERPTRDPLPVVGMPAMPAAPEIRVTTE